MRVISIINLKGGVGKTTTTVNMAYLLAKRGYKVLLVDNDKQGNASKAFGLYDPEDHDNVAWVMLEAVPLIDLAASTQYKNLDIVPANMDLLEANLRVIADVSRPQQTRIKKAISKKSIERELQGEETTSAAEEYDFIIFDNAPDVNMSIINALVVSDDVIVPVEIDQYSFDGLDILLEQIAAVKEDFNPALSFRGCLITKYRQREEVQAQGAEVLKERCNVFSTKIRRTEDKPKESTFAKIPLVEYSVRCGASQDYKKFVTEYLEMIGEASKCN
nr:MAG TPA: ParA [Caudoviricetes sp.]